MSILKVQELITPKRLIKAFLSISLYTLFFVLLEIIMLNRVYTDTYNDYETKLNNIVKLEGVDLNLMCNVVGCSEIVYNGNNYTNNNGFIERTLLPVDTNSYLGNFNKDLDTIINSNDITFIVPNDKFIDLTLSLLFSSTMIFMLFTTILYISKLISEYRSSILEKGGLKIELESKLQRDITESLHHEIGTPLAIISTLLEDLYRHLYPCDVTDDGVCDFKKEFVNKSHCKGCSKYNNNRRIDDIAIDHYYKMKFSLDRLNSIQNLIAGSKHIKYSNGTVAVYDIIENIVSTNNSFKVNKIQAEYENVDILKYYACGIGLANGELLLVMHAMVTNSIEAKSTKLKFSVDTTNTNPDKLEIILEDNGRGIRNALGEVIADKDIFNYGYSTKDPNGDNIKITSWFKKILFKLGYYNEISTRGVGLSVNKRILENSGGDIELLDTSIKGTIFKVTIPIKVRRV